MEGFFVFMDIKALQSQASQSATQGQQMLSDYQNRASQYQGDYSNYQNQANQANQSLQSYTDYMKNSGNPLNLYNTGVSQAEQSEGFDPNSLATATQNLIKQQNALSMVNGAAGSSTGGYGLSGAQLGNYYASQSQPLQGAITAQNNAVGNLQQLYQNALTQGQQGATLGFQGEQLTSQNLNQVYQNALSQQNNSLSQMQFYSQLAQQQGGLNSQQQQNYATAVSSLQQAQAALQSSSASMIQAQAGAAYNQAQTAALRQAIDAAKPASSSTPQQPAGISLGNVGVPTGPQLQGTQGPNLKSLMAPSGFQSGAGAFNLQ